MEKHINHLKTVTKESLHACYVDEYLVASPTHYSDFWARDAFWSASGLMVVGDYDRVKNTLRLFLDHQRHDGKLPRKISRDVNVVKYLFGKSITRKKLRPSYHGLVKPFHAIDSELLFVIALGDYLEETRDYDFAEEHYRQAQNALHWHTDRLKEGLVHEYFLGNWMDTVFKFGPVLYSNILYMRALESMVLIAQVAGYDDEAEVYVARARRMKRVIRERFWHEEFFADELWLKKRGLFDVAGNAMAVLWGVADEKQTEQIVTSLREMCDAHEHWIPATGDKRRWWKVNPVAYIFGIGDYHVGTHWLWIGALVVRVLHNEGHEEHAQKLLLQYHDIAQRDQEIGETYTTKGLVYKKPLWQSATPFAWSSAMLLEAMHKCDYIEKAYEYPKPEPRIC